jgi:hypothetical protein
MDPFMDMRDINPTGIHRKAISNHPVDQDNKTACSPYHIKGAHYNLTTPVQTMSQPRDYPMAAAMFRLGQF